MKILSLIWIATLTVSASLAQNEFDGTFIRKYNLSGMHGGLDLAVTSDGGFVATGQHEGNGAAGDCDVYVYRVDECGNRLWLRLIGTGGQEGGKGIEPTPDGGFIVAGIWSGSAVVIKLNGDGDTEWVHTLSNTSWGHAAIGTSDGGYATLVKSNGLPGLVKLDVNGDVEWARRYPNIGDVALRLVQLSDGGYLIAANEANNGRDVDVLRVDGEGSVIWSTSFGSGWSDLDHTHWSANAAIDESNNRIYVTAPTSGGIGGEDILLAALNLSSGDLIWSKVFGGFNSDQSRDLVLTTNGIAVLGNTMSFPTSVDSAPDALTEPLSERNILLFETDLEGNLLWSRIYGGSERDKGVGVAYDESLGFTISAYSSSAIFGNTDSSFDPIFIRTGLNGEVSCQNIEVALISQDLMVSPVSLASSEAFSTNANSVNPVISDIAPDDIYQCQNCYSEPIFEFSNDQICVGETVAFYNTTNVGFTCFQEWELTGPTLSNVTFPGNLDTLEYSFNVPGDYTMELRSTCNGVNQIYTIPLVVYESEITTTSTSNFNGFEVSCPDAQDGWVLGQAQGGYLSSASDYQWTWTHNADPLNTGFGLPENLPPGWVTLIVTDDLGCSDSTLVQLNAPSALSLSAEVTSDYNGFNVSCHDVSDGAIGLTASGGVGNYSFASPYAVSTISSSLSGLPAGEIEISVEDGNGCSTSTSVFLNAPPPINLTLTPFLDACESQSGRIQVGTWSAVGGETLFWSPNVGTADLSPSGQVQGISDLSAGIYGVTFIDSNGCEITTETEVPGTYLPEPLFSVFPDYSCLPDGEVEALDLTPGEIAWRFWEFGDETEPYLILDPSQRLQAHLYTLPGDYEVSLTVMNSDECMAQASFDVLIDPAIELFIPNSFTPNNDGLNDGFGPEGIGFKSMEFLITTRWGEQVFHSSSPEWWWNGTKNNTNQYAKQDVYIYTIEATGYCEQVERRHGIVTLLR